MGMTVSIAEGHAHVYATDNFTMGHARARVECDEELSVILPARFVKLLLDSAKNYPVAAIEFGEGWVSFSLEDETEFVGRTIGEADPDSFDQVFQSMDVKTIPIPDRLEELLKRTGSVIKAMGEDTALMEFGRETIEVSSGSKRGNLTDLIDCEGGHPRCSGNVVPALLLPSIRCADEFGLIPGKAVLFKGRGFESIISVLG